MMTGRYSSVQTLGTLDGPGVRFVLFLQGCPLSCGYCHNPETRNPTEGILTDTDDIMRQVVRCKAYFGKKGGITVSGGEPLMQAPFVTELFKKCHAEGIHTCIDTSGCMMNEYTDALLDETDLCILDIKMTNDEDYKRYIGCEQRKPLAFLEKLSEKNVETWIRQVIIEGINDNETNIRLLNDICENHDNVSFAELLPFRKLCVTKYEQMGIPFPFNSYNEPSQEKMIQLSSMISKFR